MTPSTSADFCDTNVLASAHDESETVKRVRAAALYERLWAGATGVISVQVLQELYVTLTRKVHPPVAREAARATIDDLLSWHVFEPTKRDVLDAIDNAARWQVSFWDAMLLTAANKAGATTLWTEDLNDGQRYDAVTVRNPFKEPQGGGGVRAGDVQE